MEETALLAPLLLTITGLTVGAILKSLLRHTRIPYTVGLFAIGLIAGIMDRAGVFETAGQCCQYQSRPHPLHFSTYPDI